ncbi:hypothetical protein [Halorhodospira halochloris]|uniref:hypothetical protein n=1 Tax=Halorhodospira halochloris TaxID=1052 RepID=UPI001EE90BE2|nr:hypothetical protein [Halorhodospira halochloris]MCG5548895.1 hypothetical protein [Halorhodospira halochloris]
MVTRKSALNFLIESMAKEGYREDLAPEHGTVLVGEDGQLYKTGGGSHRFYVARELGVKSVPVTVASVHEDWLRAQGVVPNRLALRELPEMLQSLKQLREI